MDDGLNAKIKYSIRSNSHFDIDSESGIIFPLKDCLKDVDFILLQIFATDRNGDINGNTAEIFLEVFKTMRHQVVAININHESFTEIPDLILQISNQSGLDLLMLNYVTIPSSEELEAKQIVDKTYTKTFVHAFDGNSKNQLDASAIIPKLKDLIYSVETIANEDQLSHHNHTGWIVAVSLLGTFLLLICIGIVAAFFWFVKPLMSNGNNENVEKIERKVSDNSQEELKIDFDAEPQSSPILPQREYETISEVRSTELPAASPSTSINIEGATNNGKFFPTTGNHQKTPILNNFI